MPRGRGGVTPLGGQGMFVAKPGLPPPPPPVVVEGGTGFLTTVTLAARMVSSHRMKLIRRSVLLERSIADGKQREALALHPRG